MNPPVRYGTRYGARPADAPTRACPVCATPLPSTRARYCSDACKQRTYRLRQGAWAMPDLPAPAADRLRGRPRGAHTIYECPVCAERALGVQRCPDCHRFGRALGPGGACPHCDEPVLTAELLG